MTHYAVNLEHIAWIEAESEEKALKEAPEEFIDLLEDVPLDMSVVDQEERSDDGT
jgi:hypothetical protein